MINLTLEELKTIGEVKSNSLIQGDCIEAMRFVADKSVDLILTDLPYGTTSCQWDLIIPFETLWEHYERIIKDNGAIILTACQPFTSLLITSNLKMYKYNLVWKKPQGVDPFMSKVRPLNNYEDICIFAKSKTIYNPQLVDGKSYFVVRDKKDRIHEITNSIMKQTVTKNNGVRLPTRIVEFNQEKGLHPTQKPTLLFEYLIETFSNVGDLVLDSCSGSGTTAIAAMNTNRNYICIEKEEKYYNKSLERIRKYNNKNNHLEFPLFHNLKADELSLFQKMDNIIC